MHLIYFITDLPYKLLVGGELLPDTPAWHGERREERFWKCITRRDAALDRWARTRLYGALNQV